MDTRALESVTKALASHKTPATREDLARETSLSARKLTNIVHKLEEVGAARAAGKRRDRGVERKLPIEDIAEAAAAQQKFQQDLRRKRLELMQALCRSAAHAGGSACCATLVTTSPAPAAIATAAKWPGVEDEKVA